MKPNNQDKADGSGGKPQTGGNRKNGPGNQGQLEQFGGSKQARRNFKQWPLCNKCRRRHLGDCNDSPRCYNCGRTGHITKDCQNCHNCGNPDHRTKGFLNCYSCGKPRHFARDCPEQEKLNLK